MASKAGPVLTKFGTRRAVDLEPARPCRARGGAARSMPTYSNRAPRRRRSCRRARRSRARARARDVRGAARPGGARWSSRAPRASAASRRRIRPAHARAARGAPAALVAVDFETAEVTALAAAAGADDVARNLRPAPDLVRETDRAAPRRAVAIAAIGHADRDRRVRAAPESERGADVSFAQSTSALDAEAVLVREVTRFEIESAAVQLRFGDEQPRPRPPRTPSTERRIGKDRHEQRARMRCCRGRCVAPREDDLGRARFDHGHGVADRADRIRQSGSTTMTTLPLRLRGTAPDHRAVPSPSRDRARGCRMRSRSRQKTLDRFQRRGSSVVSRTQ
jgi:hypothetical protein